MSETPARITVTRKHHTDVQQRQLFVSLDGEPFGTLLYGDEVTRDVAPGPHRLRAHNTLVWKNRQLDLGPGEHARFRVISRPGFGSFSLPGLLGAGLLYLTFEREP